LTFYETIKIDDFVKSPHAALRCILRRCSVRQVRFTPQDLRALPANFLQSRPKIDFLRSRQAWLFFISRFSRSSGMICH
jgi:hypothetical protein